jgi:hypothetical protein
MSKQSMSIPFSIENNRESVILIMLEQAGFLPYTGFVTKAAALNFLENLIYSTQSTVKINCGTDGENLNLIINAYPYFPELNYQLFSSYGTLSEVIIQEVEKSETIQLKLEQNVSVKYPVLEIISAEWLNEAYDTDLNLILPPPEIIIGTDVKTVSTEIPCYGSVNVTYKTLVHTYILSIIPRMNTELNPYSSVVFAVYDGGLVYLETTAPPGADETKGQCGTGVLLNLNPNVPKKRKPDPEYADRLIRVKYCTQTVISDQILSYT